MDKRQVEITYDNKWNEMDGNAMANIHLALADNVLSSIKEKKTALEIWDHLTKLFDDVVAAVLEEENRHKNKEDKLVSSQQAEALIVKKGRPLKHNSSGSKNQGRSKSRSKKNMKCYNCGKKGHLKKNCWNLNKKYSNPQGNVASTINEGGALSCEAVTTMKGKKRMVMDGSSTQKPFIT
ncbi:polyprotein [Cucumis melo var. makuwa]|uniref:Polyprotein n=1 Tax=Cucumis melo var. makuwa TaxID=1194695 RepID=A0A5D3DE66_CUCMM|nr:polyprotein [Cucumis melo var. makuwa]